MGYKDQPQAKAAIDTRLWELSKAISALVQTIGTQTGRRLWLSVTHDGFCIAEAKGDGSSWQKLHNYGGLAEVLRKAASIVDQS